LFVCLIKQRLAVAVAVMTATPLVTEFLNAINALYSHPDTAVKQEANEWLSQFQVNHSSAISHSYFVWQSMV
jgi:hypothetical protein